MPAVRTRPDVYSLFPAFPIASALSTLRLEPRSSNPNTMAGKEVIRAAQMFTKTGQASRVSVVKEIAIGLALGTGLGLIWQQYHW